MLASLIISAFTMGHKCSTLTKISFLITRRRELRQNVKLLKKELDDEATAMRVWMQDIADNKEMLARISSASGADLRMRIVNVRVCHPRHGSGRITAFDGTEKRGKPVTVTFDNGDVHKYGFASTLQKLKVIVGQADGITDAAPTLTTCSIAKPADAQLTNNDVVQPYETTSLKLRSVVDRHKVFRSWLDASAAPTNGADASPLDLSYPQVSGNAAFWNPVASCQLSVAPTKPPYAIDHALPKTRPYDRNKVKNGAAKSCAKPTLLNVVPALDFTAFKLESPPAQTLVHAVNQTSGAVAPSSGAKTAHQSEIGFDRWRVHLLIGAGIATSPTVDETPSSLLGPVARHSAVREILPSPPPSSTN